jgi:large subunit ribosomal protein L10
VPLHLAVGALPAHLAGPMAPSQGHPIRSGAPRRASAARNEKGGHGLPTDAKRETVSELQAELGRNRTLIVSEYRGLTVKEIAEIRRALRRQDVSYRIVKNRLMKIAAQDSVGDALGPLLTGPTAIAFGNDEAATAKAVIDATRPYNRIVRITGGVIGTRSIDAAGVTRLATLPAREVLLAQLGGAVTAPATQLAGLLAATLRNLGYALAQVRDQKQQAEA